MTHDLIIIGAGPIGLSCAIAMAQAGFKIALIEKSPAEALSHPSIDGRGYALSMGTCNLLKAIEVWDYIDEKEPILKIHVQENNSPFYLDFAMEGLSEDAMGYLVESHSLRSALWQGYIKNQYNINLYTDIAETSFSQDTYQVRLQIEDQLLIAPLMIACDGRQSSTRQQLGIDFREFPYNHHALVTRFKHELPHQNCAYEYFYPSGPFAILPLQGNESSLVWCDKEDAIQYLKSLSAEAFAGQLYERFPYLGPITVQDKRFSYPLVARLSKELYKGRVVLVGDAAQAIHPVAGQGLNLGMIGMADLAEQIVNARLLGRDWGDPFVLKTYARQRQMDRFKLFAITHMLVKLYNISFKPLEWVRGIGLGLVDRISPLKHVMMKEAMAVGKNKPKLMQGQKLIG